MQIKPVFQKKERPIVIAGPCSAETEEQVLISARALADQNIDLFRSGIWKPRTRPNSFEGVDRKSTRLNSSHGYMSYAVFCLKKKKFTF